MKKGGLDLQSNRIFLFVFCLISFVSIILWEFIINLINSNKCNNCCKKKGKENKTKIKDEIYLRKLKTSIKKRRSKSFNLRNSTLISESNNNN